MIGTLSTVIVCATLFALSRWWWRSLLNPVSLGIIAWTPALVMLNWPPYFLSPLYIHLNRPVSQYIYIAMGVAFLSFWAGCALVKTLSPAGSFNLPRQNRPIDFNPVVALGMFGLGLAIFLYSYIGSGLVDLANLDEKQVAESQINLHLGAISFLVLLMDVGAIALFTLFIRTGRWVFIFVPIVTLLLYAATLQKSPVVWLVSAYALIALLHPQASYRLFLSTAVRKFLVMVMAVALLLTLFLMNQARGIGETQMTAASGPIAEQLYIYSGASAIMNISVTVDGYLPSDPMAYGSYLARPVLWHFLDRDTFGATRYFGGVNTGTYLVYAWADFRWLGFMVTPFLTGVIVMLFLRFAMTGSLTGAIFGAVAMRAVGLSVATDIIFDPLTPIILVIGLVASMILRASTRSLGGATAGLATSTNGAHRRPMFDRPVAFQDARGRLPGA